MQKISQLMGEKKRTKAMTEFPGRLATRYHRREEKVRKELCAGYQLVVEHGNTAITCQRRGKKKEKYAKPEHGWPKPTAGMWKGVKPGGGRDSSMWWRRRNRIDA